MENKMNVLFLTYSPSPYRVDFFEELGKYVKLTVCFETSPKEDFKKNKRDSSWYGRSNYNFKSIYLKKLNVLNKLVSFDLIKNIKREAYDVIVIGGYSSPTAMITMEFLKRKKIPFILSTDGGFPKQNEFKLKYLIKKHFISMADYYLSSGENASRYLVYYGAKKNTIYKYPFASLKKKQILKKVVSQNEKERIRKELGLENKILFISIGRFIDIKGFDIFINASKNIKNSEFIIVGDKPQKYYLDIIKKNNIENIKFIDYKPHDELMKYLMASDVFVLATRGDVYGLVITEAFSMGLPVITTKKCGAGIDLIKDKYNGFLIEVDDINDLNSKMQYFAKNKHEIERMAINALNSIRDYSIENEAIIHYNVFKEILENKEKNK